MVFSRVVDGDSGGWLTDGGAPDAALEDRRVEVLVVRAGLSAVVEWTKP